MKKLTRKTLITILSLALIIVILGTTTFAWITISNRAAVSGMEFEVDTPNGLQIERGDVIIEKNFTNKIIENQTSNIKYLQPVSTTNGLDFYFTPNILTGIDGNGQLNANAKIYKYNEDEFSSLYSDVKTQGYAEYTYILKATASSDDLSVYLNELNFVYNGDDEDVKNSYNAFRVAVLIKNYNNGKFDDEYTSLGIIEASNSKNNTNGAALARASNAAEATKITINEKEYNVLLSNYGYTLYENGGKYYKNFGEEEYTLKTDDDALVKTANKYKLQLKEYVPVSISTTYNANGLYEFKTNLGNLVYGASPESVNNDEYFKVDGTTPATLSEVEEEITDEAVDPKYDIYGTKYYGFKTTKGKTVYSKSANGADGYFYEIETFDEQVLSTRTYLEEVQNFDAQESILDIAQGSVGYVMVTFRIYVEGEDQACTASQFIALNSFFKMDLAFGFEKPESNLKLK